jgi:multidrug efflux pump subunit AcrA (membrane-fusion protein)
MGASGSTSGVEARITIPEPDKSVTIGLDVDIRIEMETKENVLRIPVESVQTDEVGDYVYVLDREDKALRRQPVRTGISDGNAYYEVLSGLEEGTEIVRAPQRAMADGEKVRLV